MLSSLLPESVKSAIRRWIPLRLRICLFYVQRPRRLFRLYFYDHFYNGSAVVRDRFRFKLHTHDLISKFVFVDGFWEKEQCELLLRAAANCNSFVDCGANIGSITIPVAKLSAKPAVAIEPVASNFSLLSENIELNGLTRTVRAVQAAIGDGPGEQLMYLSTSNQGDHRLGWFADEPGPTEKVSVVTIDGILRICPELVPSFLVKIDIQGYECKVISGAASLVSMPRMILLEFWPWGLERAGSGVAELEALLSRHSLISYEMLPENFRLKEVGSLKALAARLPGKNFCNIVATNMDIQQTALAGLVVPGSYDGCGAEPEAFCGLPAGGSAARP